MQVIRNMSYIIQIVITRCEYLKVIITLFKYYIFTSNAQKGMTIIPCSVDNTISNEVNHTAPQDKDGI
jgi:hypothetical protein